jgi:hypothetical protein
LVYLLAHVSVWDLVQHWAEMSESWLASQMEWTLSSGMGRALVLPHRPLLAGPFSSVLLPQQEVSLPEWKQAPPFVWLLLLPFLWRHLLLIVAVLP